MSRRLYLAVACPKCKAPVGQRCVTATGRRASDSHGDRWWVWADTGEKPDPAPGEEGTT